MKNSSFEIKIFVDSKEMGKAAAKDVAALLREYTAKRKKRVVINFAAAPSQDFFLAQLCREKGIAWNKVTAVHLDEYVDLKRGHPNTFESYQREHLFSKINIPAENVHYIKALKGSAKQIAAGYGRFIKSTVGGVRKSGGIYIACIGIGVNGHIAFNEPHVNKRTPEWVIPVKIDSVSVRQQYNDYKNNPNPAARYENLEEVPRNAVTVSCAGILNADRIFCIVPGKHKADAVKAMWDGPVTDKLPASLLRMHPDMTLYLDKASAGKLDRVPLVK